MTRPGRAVKSVTRTLHFVGTHLGLLNLAAAIALRNPWLIPLSLIYGYGLAWVGHFFVEKNRPATFTYPGWSLRGDFKMLGLMWRGKMTAEVERLASGDDAPIPVQGTIQLQSDLRIGHGPDGKAALSPYRTLVRPSTWTDGARSTLLRRSGLAGVVGR